MCGRIAITLPHDAMTRLFAATPANDLPPVPRYNVTPTSALAVVVAQGGNRRYGAMRWGLIPRWYKHPTDGPLLFNARAETLAEKPAFAEAARKRRCLIPVSGFYEWTRDGDTRLPWYVTRADGDPMILAGVWQTWTDPQGTRLATCAVITTAAQGPMAALHDRVPVIVETGDWPLWLGEAGHGAARLMRPLADDALTMHRVGTAVNSNRAEGPELIDPLLD